MGGGNGSAITLQALKRFIPEIELSGVISMSDSGGSSGQLRREFDTLPAGDIMRAILSLSIYDYKILKNIFYEKRFINSGKLDKHNLGNLFLVLTEKYNESWIDSISALEQAISAKGKIFPVTLDKTDLCVELSDGSIIKTEEVIDRPGYDRNKKIKKAWLEPEGKIYSGAKKVIEEADYIFLGPGSFYCSIIAALLSKGAFDAINKSKAKLIYIAGGAYELKGETGPVKLSDFILELESYLPRLLDLIVYNNFKWYEEKQEKNKNWGEVIADFENIDMKKLLRGNFQKEIGELDIDKLSLILKDIIK